MLSLLLFAAASHALPALQVPYVVPGETIGE